MIDISALVNPNDPEELKALYEAIESRVQELLDTDPNLLFSYLYRLDVLENDIKAVLDKSSGIDPVRGLSQLILDRQILRLKSRIKYRENQQDDEWHGTE